MRINGMSHQRYVLGIHTRYIYPDLRKYLCRKNSDVILDRFFNNKALMQEAV